MHHKRVAVLGLIDSIIVVVTIFLSRLLFINDFILSDKVLLMGSVILLISHHVYASTYKLYKKFWMYASTSELIVIFKSITLSIFTTALLQAILMQTIYLRLLAVTWMLHILLIGGSRFSWRIYHDGDLKKGINNKKTTLIVGAGSAGIMVVRQLMNNKETDLQPTVLLDDDRRKHGLEIMGVPVIGGINRIEDVVKSMKIDHVVIAIPSLNKKELNEIYQKCIRTTAKTQIMPGIEDLMLGKVTVNQLKDVKVEDLLIRDPVELDTENIAGTITGKVVLVTGAGGSIGSEICRQISKFGPSQLILLGHGENSIYNIEMELKENYGNHIQLTPVIADIQDRDRVLQIMSRYRPSMVYHAAAHKHVPLMEANPHEAVKNNIIGTKNVAEAALIFDVSTFVMISTDKAVNPTSVMGATKRIAEIYIQGLDKQGNTKFVAVRFGNVLGSRGSVIPMFKKQIQKGGPVTVTHPDMKRYFMTIPEASRLVIQAGALAKGGEIFVLDMGQPVKIVDLAKNLIKLSGYSIEEIGIKFTGIRPGEKLYEELLNPNEVKEMQVFPKIYVGKSVNAGLIKYEELINEFSLLDAASLASLLLDVAHNRIETTEPILAVNN